MKMRRFLCCCFLGVFLFVSFFSLSALAADPQTPDRVIDGADLLTAEEETALRRRIAELTEQYACDIVILTADSLYGQSPRSYADTLFDDNDCGIGSERDGILLLVSMATRDWYISTSGKAISAFSDYGISYIGERVAALLGVTVPIPITAAP